MTVKRRTVNTRSAYEKGWAAARDAHGATMEVLEGCFVRRYGQHKVYAWTAGWEDRRGGERKWTNLPADDTVSHTPVSSDRGSPTPPRRRTMPGKRAKDTHVRSVPMPDALWRRAEKRAAEEGTSASHVIRDALELHVPAEPEVQPEPQPV